jgi:hypothetical protein
VEEGETGRKEGGTEGRKEGKKKKNTTSDTEI